MEAVVGVVVPDPELAKAPEGPGDAAVVVARTRAERDALHVQVLARLPVVPQLLQEPLHQGDVLTAALGQRVGREFLVLLVSLHARAEPLAVALRGHALVRGHRAVVVVPVVRRRRREALTTLEPRLIQGHALGHEHCPVEPARVVLDGDQGEVHLEAKDLAVKLLHLGLPVLDPERILNLGGEGWGGWNRTRGIQLRLEVWPIVDQLEQTNHALQTPLAVSNPDQSLADQLQQLHDLVEFGLVAALHGVQLRIFHDTPLKTNFSHNRYARLLLLCPPKWWAPQEEVVLS